MRTNKTLASRAILALLSIAIGSLATPVFAVEQSERLGLPERGNLETLTIVTGHPESDLLTLVGSASRQQLLVERLQFLPRPFQPLAEDRSERVYAVELRADFFEDHIGTPELHPG